MGQADGLMSLGPPKAVETIVALLAPPASREEVVGDLHERYRSPAQYAMEVIRTVPLIIASRIRRTADLYVLLAQALAIYSSFLLSGWMVDRDFRRDEWSPARLGIPVGAILLGLLLEDAYADPASKRRWSPARGPILGFTLAWLLETVWKFGHSHLAVPLLIMLWGSAAGLPVSSALRMLFPPVVGRLKGVNAPADWLKQSREPASMRTAIVISCALILVYVALRSIGRI